MYMYMYLYLCVNKSYIVYASMCFDSVKNHKKLL